MYYIGQTIIVKKKKYPAIIKAYVKPGDSKKEWKLLCIGRNKKESTYALSEVDYLFNGDSTSIKRKIYLGDHSTNRLFANQLELDKNKTEINRYLSSVNKNIKNRKIQTRLEYGKAYKERVESKKEEK